MKLEIIQSRALEKSIIKWEKKGDRFIDNACENCELCKKFNDCTDCPVYLKVDDCGCGKTPYIEWNKHQRKSHNKHYTPFKIECEECEKLRIKELEFLKSLRKL